MFILNLNHSYLKEAINLHPLRNIDKIIRNKKKKMYIKFFNKKLVLYYQSLKLYVLNVVKFFIISSI